MRTFSDNDGDIAGPHGMSSRAGVPAARIGELGADPAAHCVTRSPPNSFGFDRYSLETAAPW